MNKETSSMRFFFARSLFFRPYYGHSFELFIIRTNIHCINKLLKLSSPKKRKQEIKEKRQKNTHTVDVKLIRKREDDANVNVKRN